MKRLILTSIIGLALAGCGEKTITVKEFKENRQLHEEWVGKCMKEKNLKNRSCLNAYEAAGLPLEMIKSIRQ